MASCPPSSCGGRGGPPPAAVVQPAEVVGQGHQLPFTAHLLQPSDQELPEAEPLFDEPEGWLGHVLAALVDGASLLRPGLPTHPLAGSRRLRNPASRRGFLAGAVVLLRRGAGGRSPAGDDALVRSP